MFVHPELERYPTLANLVHLDATVREECVNFADKEDSALMTTPHVDLVEQDTSVFGDREVKSRYYARNLLLPCRVQKIVPIVLKIKSQIQGLQHANSVQMAKDMTQRLHRAVKYASLVNTLPGVGPTGCVYSAQMVKCIRLISLLAVHAELDTSVLFQNR